MKIYMRIKLFHFNIVWALRMVKMETIVLSLSLTFNLLTIYVCSLLKYSNSINTAWRFYCLAIFLFPFWSSATEAAKSCNSALKLFSKQTTHPKQIKKNCWRAKQFINLRSKCGQHYALQVASPVLKEFSW